MSALAVTVRGDGPRIVLLHGVGLDRTIWDLVAPRLVDAGYEVVTPDLRGHGRSPRIPEGRIELDDLAADVEPLLGSAAHLVGFSLGGLVALRVAQRAPARVRTVTAVATVSHRTDEERAAVRGRLETAGRDLDASWDAALERWFGHGLGDERRDLLVQTRAVLDGNDPVSYLACYRVFAEEAEAVDAGLGAITSPLLAVTGADDPGSTPRMSAAIAAAVPDGDLLVLGGARHLLPYERPAALAHAIIGHVAGKEEA